MEGQPDRQRKPVIPLLPGRGDIALGSVITARRTGTPGAFNECLRTLGSWIPGPGRPMSGVCLG